MVFRLGCALFLFLCSTTFAQDVELPKPNAGEYILLALSKEQCQGLVPEKNYSAQCSLGGVCYGIDRVNYTLLTNVSFTESSVPDSDQEITRKIIQAHENDQRITINGFKNIKDFMEKMKAKWNDQGNPLKKAIEDIQGKQPAFGVLAGMIAKKKFVAEHGEDALPLEARYFQRLIGDGVPVEITIKDDSGAHALTVIGFRKSWNAPDGLPTEFFVLDSNRPGKLTPIKIRTFEESWVGPYGTEKRSYTSWYYEPWDAKGKKDKDGNTYNGRIALMINPPDADAVKKAKDTFSPQLVMGDDTVGMLDFYKKDCMQSIKQSVLDQMLKDMLKKMMEKNLNQINSTKQNERPIKDQAPITPPSDSSKTSPSNSASTPAR